MVDLIKQIKTWPVSHFKYEALKMCGCIWWIEEITTKVVYQELWKFCKSCPLTTIMIDNHNLLAILVDGLHCVLHLGTPLVQHLLGGAQKEALRQSEVLIFRTEAPWIWIPLQILLHSSNNCINSFRWCFHSWLQIIGWEGDVFHAKIWLKSVCDVLISL